MQIQLSVSKPQACQGDAADRIELELGHGPNADTIQGEQKTDGLDTIPINLALTDASAHGTLAASTLAVSDVEVGVACSGFANATPASKDSDVSEGSTEYNAMGAARTSIEVLSPDPSVLFGLERGILSMMNLLVSVTVIGGGLMYINAGHLPRVLGATSIAFACFFMLVSFVFFAYRLRVLSQGGGASIRGSMLWIGTFTFILVAGISVVTGYAIVYPPDSPVWSAPVTISESELS